MRTIKRFYAYWGNTLKGAKDEHEAIVSAISTFAAVLAVLGYTKNFLPVINALSIAIAVALLLRAIFWLPFKRHEAQEKRHKQEIEKLTSEIDSKKSRIEVSAKLGDYLGKLENRIQEIRALGYMDYVRPLTGLRDQRSVDLIDEISDFIEKNVGHHQAIMFKSLSGIQYGQTAANRNSPPLTIACMKQHMNMGYIFIRPDWEAAITELTQWAAQLREVIQTLN